MREYCGCDFDNNPPGHGWAVVTFQCFVCLCFCVCLCSLASHCDCASFCDKNPVLVPVCLSVCLSVCLFVWSAMTFVSVGKTSSHWDPRPKILFVFVRTVCGVLSALVEEHKHTNISCWCLIVCFALLSLVKTKVNKTRNHQPQLGGLKLSVKCHLVETLLCLDALLSTLLEIHP